jgi:YD repeat-containing protein
MKPVFGFRFSVFGGGLLSTLLVLTAPLYAATPGNRTVFARSIQVPNLGAGHVVPTPRDRLDPLDASRQAHWRCRYVDGRLVEVARRDAEGTLAPMRAVYERTPTNGYLFRYAAAGAQPVLLTTPRGFEYALTYDRAGMLTAAQRLGRAPVFAAEPTRITIERARGRVVSVRSWRGAAPTRDADGVHQREFQYGSDGYLTRVVYRDTAGRVCAAAQGCAAKTYRRGPHGEWLDVAWWDAQGAACADWHGVARYAFEYTSNGLLRLMRIFDARQTPATNALGAHALEWQYDSAMRVIGTRGFDATNALVYDGPALMPDVFERTWAEAVLMREKNELSLPFWSFVDYSELERSLRRHVRRVASNGVTPYAVEQLRVLAEYIMASRAGYLAVLCAQMCGAAGLNDPRWLRVACRHAGTAPRPGGAAAQWLRAACWDTNARDALVFVSSDPLYYVLLDGGARSAAAGGPVVLHAQLLADNLYNATLESLYGTNIWLPDLQDVRRAVEDYARSAAARQALENDTITIDMAAERAGIIGQPAVAQINATLMRDMVLRTPRRVLYEEAIPVTIPGVMRVPDGPLFALLSAGVATGMAVRTDDVLRAWTARAADLAGRPKTRAWRAVRHVMSALAGAHAACFYDTNAQQVSTQLFAVAGVMAPDAPYAPTRHARLLLQAGDVAAATAVLARCDQRVRDYASVQSLLRECAAACARADRIALLRAQIAQGTHTASNVMELADLYLRTGQITNALTVARSFMAAATNDVAVYEWYATLLARCGDWDGAAQALARLTEQQPGNFNYWTSRAALAFSCGAGSNGIAYLRRAAALDQQRLARILTAHGFLDELRDRGQTNLVKDLELLFLPDAE